MAAGAEGQARVEDELDPVGVVLLPGRNDGETIADVHRVIILAPAVLPVLLLDTLGLDGVGDAGSFHPGRDEGQRLDGRCARLEVHVDDDGITRLVQQLLLDEVDMGNFSHLLLDVAVILDVDAALGDQGGNGFGVIGVSLSHGQADIGPFHGENLLQNSVFPYNSIVPDSRLGCKPLGKMSEKRKEFST